MKSMKLATLVAAAIAGLMAGTAQAAVGASGLKVMSKIPGPDGGWDYASFDAKKRILFVAHGDKVMAIRVDTGRVQKAFANGAHLHAVLPVPDSDLILTTNSGDSTARLINGKTGALVASIPTAKGPDAAVFDPKTGLILVMCGDAGEIVLIDPKAAVAVGSIVVGGALEFAAVDGKGRAYVNIEDAGKVAVIDLEARKVLDRYPLADCLAPTGLALTDDGRLIAACSNGRVKILYAATGKEIASHKIGMRPDAVLLDEGRGLAYVPSALSGDMAVIALSGAKANTVIDTVPTAIGARTGAVDLKSGRIYLPTAQYNLPVAAGQRPTTKPGTFVVLVLDR